MSLFKDCPTDHPRWDQQVRLEERARDGGVARFNAAVAKAAERNDAGSTGAASSIVQRSIGPVADAIVAFIDGVKAGRVAAQARVVPLIAEVQPELLAYVALRVSIGAAFHSRPDLTKAAFAVGQAVYDEVKVAAFERDNKDYLRAVLMDLNKRTGDISWKRTVVVHSMNKKGFVFPKWTRAETAGVGSLLISRIIEATGLYNVEQAYEGQKSIAILRVSDEMVRWVNDANQFRSQMFPQWLPMVVPPRMWTNDQPGGYWCDLSTRLPKLVRTSGKREAPQAVLDALNIVQLTGWRINRPVLETMTTVWNTMADTDVLPRREPVELPPKPHDIDTNEEARKAWRYAAGLIHRKNRKTQSQRFALAAALKVAEELVDEEALYFPHNLDFRGRLYPMPVFLNPQGPDYVKSLLTFSEGKPIEDAVAAGWLAIHGANCWGTDKVSLEERIGWVEDNEEMILQSARDPLANRGWMDADEPWQFLAFCFEWLGFIEQGYGYISNLPCMVDGSCNGIQHFSAMLRDPVGGSAVNLVPSNRPSDIYQRVADRVKERLECLIQSQPSGSPSSEEYAFAHGWLTSSCIDRKVTKRPVMVLPYGGTQKSCRDYVKDAISEKIEGGMANPFPADQFIKAVNFLAGHVWESISDVVVAAREAMGWLQQVGRLMAKHNVHPQWVTPDGFNVVQHYVDLKETRVDTYFRGMAVLPPDRRLSRSEKRKMTGYQRLTVTEETDKLSVRLNTNGIAPNFVHSMDGTALRNTVTLAFNNGVDAFAVVHDSYGTHAADMETLGACIRHAFVEMYEGHDVLQELYDNVLPLLPEAAREELPVPPKKGKLDLSQVHKSDFFFA